MDKRNGRAAFIIAQGVQFHGNKEGEIRKELIKSDIIEAVINLASGVFFGTSVSACIFVLNNNKSREHMGKILLIDASDIYTAQIAQEYKTHCDNHALPENFETMDYMEFLSKRRTLMAQIIKKAFARL